MPRPIAGDEPRSGRIEMRVEPSWLKKLDYLRTHEFQRSGQELPNRTELIRRLVEEVYEQRVSSAA